MRGVTTIQLMPSPKPISAPRVKLEPLSLADLPSMAMPFTGRMKGAGKTALWDLGDYFIVTEENPIPLASVVSRIAGLANELIPIKYRYSGSLFYKLSRNPIGPSKRPLLVLGLEHSPMSSTYFERGILDRLRGREPVPTHLHVGCFMNDQRVRLGMIPNSVEDGSGHKLVATLTANQCGIDLPNNLDPVFSDLGWDHALTQ